MRVDDSWRKGFLEAWRRGGCGWLACAGCAGWERLYRQLGGFPSVASRFRLRITGATRFEPKLGTATVQGSVVPRVGFLGADGQQCIAANYLAPFIQKHPCSKLLPVHIVVMKTNELHPMPAD